MYCLGRAFRAHCLTAIQIIFNLPLSFPIHTKRFVLRGKERIELTIDIYSVDTVIIILSL